jgi:elongation factor P
MFMDMADSSIYDVDTKEAEAFLPFIEEDMTEKCVLTICENKVVGIQAPMIVSRRVVHIDSIKITAKLQNGTEVEVDDSVQVGDLIDIDPSDGSFLGLSEE